LTYKVGEVDCKGSTGEKEEETSNPDGKKKEAVISEGENIGCPFLQVQGKGRKESDARSKRSWKKGSSVRRPL